MLVKFVNICGARVEMRRLVVLASAAASLNGYNRDNIKNNKLFHFEEFESHFDSL